MITVYLPNETDFSHNGLGVLNPTSADVTEELNGMHELSVNCSLSSIGLPPQEIGDYYIIKALAPKGYQLFRVYNTNKLLNGEIQITARHISYDALNHVFKSVKAANRTADAAMKLIFSGSGVSASSSMDAQITADIDFINTNAINALIGDSGIIEVYGGELSRDNYTIELKREVGEDRGFTIMYQKNLAELNMESDTDELATRLMPVAQDAEGEPLYLPETYINSPLINAYHAPIVKFMDYKDIRLGDEEYPDISSVHAEMRRRCNDFFAQGGDLPKINAKIDFVLLRDTIEYMNYRELERIYLGDTVTVTHGGMDIRLKSKCIKYTYDAILGRYKSIELGQFRGDFVVNTSSSISRITGGVNRSPGSIDSQINKLTADIAVLRNAVYDHRHKGNATDPTFKIDYNDLINKP